MATYVKGDAVANATSYELFENVDGTYNSLATASEINFEVSALGLAAGDHNLVVKAKADGYEDSDYSNAVTYTEPVPSGVTTTIAANGGAKSYIVKVDGSTMSGGSFGNLEYDIGDYAGSGTITIKTSEYATIATDQYVDVVLWALFSGTVGTDTILTPVGPDVHETVYTDTIDMSLYPTATKLRIFGTKSTMATEAVVTHTS